MVWRRPRLRYTAFSTHRREDELNWQCLLRVVPRSLNARQQTLSSSSRLWAASESLVNVRLWLNNVDTRTYSVWLQVVPRTYPPASLPPPPPFSPRHPLALIWHSLSESHCFEYVSPLSLTYVPRVQSPSIPANLSNRALSTDRRTPPRVGTSRARTRSVLATVGTVGVSRAPPALP